MLESGKSLPGRMDKLPGRLLRAVWLLFPGATLFLLYLTQQAIRSDSFRDYNGSLLLLSCYMFYAGIYAILRVKKSWISTFLAAGFTCSSFLLIQLHKTTGRMFTSNIILQFSLKEIIGLFIESNGAILAFLIPLLFFIFVGIRSLFNRLAQVLKMPQRQKAKPALLIFSSSLLIQVLVFLEQPHLQAHLPYFFSSSIRPALLAAEARVFPVAAEAKSIAGLFQNPELYSYPVPEYPFFRVPHLISTIPKRPRPIFILLMESFNARQLEYMEENQGKPSFASTIKERALTTNRFYANGQDSMTGQIATLCSLSPGIIKHSVLGQNFACLPQLLRQAGYRTLFYYDIASSFSASSRSSMEWLGFDEFQARLKNYDPGLKPRFGWSMEGDAVYYKDVFQHLKKNIIRKEPLFVVIANSENHFPYDQSEGMLALMLQKKRWPQLFRNSQGNAVKALQIFQ